jgi:hypothetical protein
MNARQQANYKNNRGKGLAKNVIVPKLVKPDKLTSMVDGSDLF